MHVKYYTVISHKYLDNIILYHHYFLRLQFHRYIIRKEAGLVVHQTVIQTEVCEPECTLSIKTFLIKKKTTCGE